MKELEQGLAPKSELLPVSVAKVITKLELCKYLFKNSSNFSFLCLIGAFFVLLLSSSINL